MQHSNGDADVIRIPNYDLRFRRNANISSK